MSRYTAGMDRRTFFNTVGTAMLALPLAVEAQPGGKVWRIGYLDAGTPSARTFRDALIQGLQDLGYLESRDFVMEYRWAEGQMDRLPDLAADLVRAQVDIIVTGGT